MAKQVVVQSVCDLCGAPSDGTTYRFGWALTNYEIDLCPDHAEELASVMERMSASGRRLGAPPKSIDVETAPEPARSQVSTPVVRAWAKKNGIDVSHGGRIPDEVFEQYLASTSAGDRSS